MTLVHLIGAPCAGKSTLARAWQEAHPHWAHLAIDKFAVVGRPADSADRFAAAVEQQRVDCLIEHSGLNGRLWQRLAHRRAPIVGLRISQPEMVRRLWMRGTSPYCSLLEFEQWAVCALPRIDQLPGVTWLPEPTVAALDAALTEMAAGAA